MRTVFTNRLHQAVILPSLLSLILAVGTAYVGYKSQRTISNSPEEMRQVKERINASQCDASYKNASISIVDGSVKLIRDFSIFCYAFSAVSFVIGATGMGIFVSVRRREQRAKNQ